MFGSLASRVTPWIITSCDKDLSEVINISNSQGVLDVLVKGGPKKTVINHTNRISCKMAFKIHGFCLVSINPHLVGVISPHFSAGFQTGPPWFEASPGFKTQIN